MGKFFVAIVLCLAFVSHAFAQDASSEPRPLNVLQTVCGPFEIWSHVTPEKLSQGDWRYHNDRFWAHARFNKDFDLALTSTFALADTSKTISCTVSTLTSELLNPEGDVLVVTRTCGLYIPAPLNPSFVPEEVFYILGKRGELLKKGICTKHLGLNFGPGRQS